MVFDLTGKSIKTYPLNKNQSELFIKASDIGSGLFIYSLVQNGQELLSKKMVVKQFSFSFRGVSRLRGSVKVYDLNLNGDLKSYNTAAKSGDFEKQHLLFREVSRLRGSV